MINFQTPNHQRHYSIDVSTDELKLVFLKEHHSSLWKRVTHKVRVLLDECSKEEMTLKKTRNRIKKMSGQFSAWKESSWKSRGYTPVEAEIEVKITQSKNASNNDYTKDDRTETQLGYWIKKGFSEEDARIKLSERQTTYTKEMVIAKLGKEEGLKKMTSIQEKKKKTFHLRPQNEQDQINISRCRKKLKIDSVNNPSVLYYFKFTDLKDQKDYWKIGISENSFNRRYPITIQKRYQMRDIQILSGTLEKCFKAEQSLLEVHHLNRKITSLSTECFDRDIFKTIKKEK